MLMETESIERVIGKCILIVLTFDRINCFESTLVHLTERFNGKEVYLVGTSNQSTMLAQRTQKLIQEI
jgi:hypothetical protein